MMGQEIATIVDRQPLSAGFFSAYFAIDKQNLTQGVYILGLTQNGIITNRKVVIE